MNMIISGDSVVSELAARDVAWTEEPVLGDEGRRHGAGGLRRRARRRGRAGNTS